MASFDTNQNLRVNRPNKLQIESLVSYMETHVFFARQQITKLGKKGKQTYDNMWKNLTSKLNSLGSCNRSCGEWKKTWKNLRLKAKQKAAIFYKLYQRTGNNEPEIGLDNLCKRISNIFGKYGTGIPIIEEAGLPVMVKKFNVSQRLEKNDATRQRPTQKQMNYLLQFMKKNESFAKGDMPHEALHIMWQSLAKELNSIPGGTLRPVENWIRSWNEMRQRSLKNQNTCKKTSEKTSKCLEDNYDSDSPSTSNGFSKSAFLFNIPIKKKGTTQEKTPIKKDISSSLIILSDEEESSDEDEPLPKKAKISKSEFPNESTNATIVTLMEEQNKMFQRLLSTIIEVLRNIENVIDKVATTLAPNEKKNEEQKNEE